ncbi:MAG: sugar kinase [Lachnospiraceae bacterium]|nr:sugar kinase [Lachnospiraceae bacterium]
MRIITFGEILLRLNSPGYNKLFQKDYMETSFCGAEANVAVSLSVLGLDVAFVSKLPDNVIGHAALNSLRYFGVDIDNIILGSGRMGLYYLEKGASQRASKIIYDRNYSSIALANKDEFDWNNIFDGADWFHWSGINPALSDELANICKIACIVAKEKGLTVSCDLNYRAKLWDEYKAQSIMKPLMKYVDVCICNEEDAEKVLGIKSLDNCVETANLSIKGYLNSSRIINKKYGCKYIATTLRKSYSASNNGWSGLLYDCKTDDIFESPQYDIQVIDRVGGGDSFAAGLIYGFVNNMDYQKIIDFATAASCLKQTMEGDFNRSTINDIETLISQGGNGRVQR